MKAEHAAGGAEHGGPHGPALAALRRQTQRRIPRPQIARQPGRAVGAAVVGHQHAIVHAPLGQKRGQLGQRPGQAFLFIIGGNDDRQVMVGRSHRQTIRPGPAAGGTLSR